MDFLEEVRKLISDEDVTAYPPIVWLKLLQEASKAHIKPNISSIKHYLINL
jgi:hypothetical protein